MKHNKTKFSELGIGDDVFIEPTYNKISDTNRHGYDNELATVRSIEDGIIEACTKTACYDFNFIGEQIGVGSRAWRHTLLIPSDDLYDELDRREIPYKLKTHNWYKESTQILRSVHSLISKL